jgi:ferric reductase like protein
MDHQIVVRMYCVAVSLSCTVGIVVSCLEGRHIDGLLSKWKLLVFFVIQISLVNTVQYCIGRCMGPCLVLMPTNKLRALSVLPVQDGKNVWGLAALCTQIVITVSSFECVRRKRFEWFYYLHFLFFGMYVLTSTMRKGLVTLQCSLTDPPPVQPRVCPVVTARLPRASDLPADHWPVISIGFIAVAVLHSRELLWWFLPGAGLLEISP